MKTKSLPFLSKTKYMDGLRCPKLLWYEYNRKEEMPKPDVMAQAIMDQGKKVGELAQKLFPGGIRLERDFVPEKQAEKSLEAAKLGKPLFEPGFTNKRAYALADILNPVGNKAWDLIEVKSSTGVKDEYVDDVAFQKYTYEGAGLKIRRCYVMYINNEYVRKGEIDPEGFFIKEDVTDDVNEIVSGIEEAVDRMIKTIAEKDVPKIKIGPQCNSPRACLLQGICQEFLPTKDNVFCLYRGAKKAYSLIDRGILSLKDIDENSDLNDTHYIQVKSHKSGKPHIDKKGIEEFLGRLEYPLYFLDFETIGLAIPQYDDSRPYENIPFQYSLFIIDKKGAKPESHSYIAKGDKDPRPEVLKNLKNLLGDKGSIIAYNDTFEKNVLRNAATIYPEYMDWVDATEERFIDLLGPFRSFLYYHPSQEGSASLKSVLPAITKSSYENMQIADGSTASLEYCRVTFNKDISEEERKNVYSALEKYCDLDTKGMIEIVEALKAC